MQHIVEIILELNAYLEQTCKKLWFFQNFNKCSYQCILRRLYGLKRDEVMGGWRELHNEALCDLCSSPKIIRIIKSRRMRWVGHMAQMGRKGTCVGYR
jgi:hypothetical protein